VRDFELDLAAFGAFVGRLHWRGFD
jgi:hypothetical protein